MATKHWVRDLLLTESMDYDTTGNQPEMNFLLYQFLRVAGWQWIWECDGEITADSARNPNHVSDGNMETAGTAYWSAVAGGTPSKVTTPVQSGLQALMVGAATAGDGVKTTALVSIMAMTGGNSGIGSLTGPNGRGEMTLSQAGSYFTSGHLGSYLKITGSVQAANNGTWLITKVISTTSVRILNPLGVAEGYTTSPPPGYTITLQVQPRYELFFQARNAQTWDVQVDPGTGVFASIGTIPASGGAYVRHHLEFRRQGSGSVYVQFVATAADTLYLDSVFAFHSYWEWNGGMWMGSDGVITAPNLFSSPSYTFSGDDVGWQLFVWDPDNNKNSGVYSITGVSGGSAVLNLRSGSAALVNSLQPLNWRLADVMSSAPDEDTGERFSGYGLESFHSSRWRTFSRHNMVAGQNYKGIEVWGAPEDTDFNTDTGAFYKSGPSSQRNKQGEYFSTSANSVDNMHLWRSNYNYSTADMNTHSWIMTDEDGNFFTFVHHNQEQATTSCVFMGYTGADPYHPGIEEWCLFARWESPGQDTEIYFDQTTTRFSYLGTCIGPDGMTRHATIAQLGYSTTGTPSIETMSNAGINPWSGREWLRPLLISRDPWGGAGQGSLRNADCGMFQMRANKTLFTTVDSNAFLHTRAGLVWEWSGESIL